VHGSIAPPLTPLTPPSTRTQPASHHNLPTHKPHPTQPPEPTMPTHPVFRAGATALITGGASGIGLAVAHLCKSHGMNVALVDNNAALLSAAKTALAGDTQTYTVDVSKRDEWQALREKVREVDFLMLNAGIGLNGDWEDVDYFHKVRQETPQPVLRGVGGQQFVSITESIKPASARPRRLFVCFVFATRTAPHRPKNSPAHRAPPPSRSSTRTSSAPSTA